MDEFGRLCPMKDAQAKLDELISRVEIHINKDKVWDSTLYSNYYTYIIIL